MFYNKIVRPALFSLKDPEDAHELLLLTAHFSKIELIRKTLEKLFFFESENLQTQFCGLNFKNPIGLAAGFDKDCAAYELLSALGFGFIELGTITYDAQLGNPRPRIERIVEQQALINSMGFPSRGYQVCLDRLAKIKCSNARQSTGSVIGVNLGKNKDVSNDQAAQAYATLFDRLSDYGEYFTINVSSPNTPDLRKLQNRESLGKIFNSIKEYNVSQKPVLLKISPDLSSDDLYQVLDFALDAKISGIIATNTTLDRARLVSASEFKGGLSGQPLFELSKSVVLSIYKYTNGNLPIIACGGISNAQDAFEMIKSGASLVQIYTALIYQGPAFVYRLKRDLADLVTKSGFRSIANVRGTFA